MSLEPGELNRLSKLLDEAIDLDAESRAAWLGRLGGEDLKLLPTLRQLLARQAAMETDDLLERGPSFTAPADSLATAQFAAGEQVGPYRLERAIGQGGMGEVWLAVREDGHLKRQVALKLPMLSARRNVLVQRFARERDILGSLAHPNIARLYDAGLAGDGQPYLALEYVEGQSVTTYCADSELDLRARVRLLQQVLQAVQYAHANLVIHRDLKPSNVLVTAQGQAMLLDFGIAKLLQEDAPEAAETELTRLGGRAMTLHYAAPEQISGAPISIATDVWALGVLLYQVLTGERPFSGKPRELENAILHAEPARPQGLPADLATIVLKALKKAPAERYATANAFSEDLGRWLANEPVLAQPDSPWYRTRKFLGRHRMPMAAGMVVVIVLLATSLIALHQAAEARRQTAVARQQAELAKKEAQRAQAVQAFLSDLFRANTNQQSDPQAARRTSARDLLDRGAASIDKALADSPQSRIEVMATLADMYMQLNLYDQAAALQQRRVALAREVYGPRDPTLADILVSYAETLQEGSHRDEIPALLAEATAVLDSAGDDRSFLRGAALIQTARYLRYESLREALQSADAAVALFVRFHPDRASLVTAYSLASHARMNRGDFEGGEEQAALAMQAARRRGAATAAWLQSPTVRIAEAQLGQMKFAEAEANLRASIALGTHLQGAGSPSGLVTTTRLGNLLLTVGRRSEGEAVHASVRAALLADDPRRTAQWRVDEDALLEATMNERGRPDLALASIRASIDDLQRNMPHSSLLAQSQRRLAELQAALGHIAAARESMALADASWRKVAADTDAGRIETSFAISRARVALAAEEPSLALAQLDLARPATPSDAIERRIERARALTALGRADAAASEAEAALGAIADLPEGQRPVALQASALEQRGEALRRLGDRGAAVADLKQALDLRRANDTDGSRRVAVLERELAIARRTPSHAPGLRSASSP
jgi:eukaryotic-like serine/threonine-protein kinase